MKVKLLSVFLMMLMGASAFASLEELESTTNPYSTLSDWYAQGETVAPATLENVYRGRCYLSHKWVTYGSYLAKNRRRDPRDDGPGFPPNSLFKLDWNVVGGKNSRYHDDIRKIRESMRFARNNNWQRIIRAGDFATTGGFFEAQ